MKDLSTPHHYRSRLLKRRITQIILHSDLQAEISTDSSHFSVAFLIGSIAFSHFEDCGGTHGPTHTRTRALPLTPANKGRAVTHVQPERSLPKAGGPRSLGAALPARQRPHAS